MLWSALSWVLRLPAGLGLHFPIFGEVQQLFHVGSRVYCSRFSLCLCEPFSAGVLVHMGRMFLPLCLIAAVLSHLAVWPPSPGPLFIFEDGTSLSCDCQHPLLWLCDLLGWATQVTVAIAFTLALQQQLWKLGSVIPWSKREMEIICFHSLHQDTQLCTVLVSLANF